MLDRFDDLMKMVKDENISMSLNDVEEGQNNDRELIQEFLEHT